MKRPRQKSACELREQCAAWNRDVPIGTAIKFHPVIGDEKHRLTESTGLAWVLGDHTAVVNLKGVPGCVALEACEIA